MPFRRPRNNLTAPSTSPVVYRSRPILRVSGRADGSVFFSYQGLARPQGQPLRTLSSSLGIYPLFPKKTGRIPFPWAIRTSPALSSGNKWSRVSCKTEGVNIKREMGVSGTLTIPHFSSLLAAKRNQSAALLRAPFSKLSCAACANNNAAGVSSAWEINRSFTHQKPLWNQRHHRREKRTEPAAQTSHRSPSSSLLRKSCLVIPVSHRTVYARAVTSIEAG